MAAEGFWILTNVTEQMQKKKKIVKIILLCLYTCSIIFVVGIFRELLSSRGIYINGKVDSDQLALKNTVTSVSLESKGRHGSSKSFVVPFLSGQGLNNQLWEYHSSARIAKALGRSLCLEPFHRFYLLKKGREFIPFDELFNSEALKKYVDVEKPRACSNFCNKRVQRSFMLVHKSGIKINEKKPYPIPDWRPGSLKKFRLSTGFGEIPAPEMINVEEQRGGIKYHTLQDIQNAFKDTKNAACISVSGHAVTGRKDELKSWYKALEVSKDIKQAVDKVKRETFLGQKYLAIHWRFEETKCSGIGRSIGHGRDRKGSLPLDRNKSNFVIKRSDAEAEFCFFSGPIIGTPKVLLRLVSRIAIIRWILNLKKRSGASFLYLATDCADISLLRWIKESTGAITRSDILPLLHNKIDNDVISRIEQQICADALIFAGTQMSSWTTKVIEERFLQDDKIFTQNKTSLRGKPDMFSNRTLYFDVEVCDYDS